VVATGVTATGGREVLGVDVGDSEDEVFWRGFLRSLKERGLHGTQLVISDAGSGDFLSMSTPDQLLYGALHGTAMRFAVEKRDLAESIAELRVIADGRNDILAGAAGITAGSWYASPAAHVGHELIAAGMLILAGGGEGVPLDYGELERPSQFLKSDVLR
jgi:hypothetical protein